jgi:hypothetical protein
VREFNTVLEELTTKYGDRRYAETELSDLKLDAVSCIQAALPKMKGSADSILAIKLCARIKRARTQIDVMMRIAEAML